MKREVPLALPLPLPPGRTVDKARIQASSLRELLNKSESITDTIVNTFGSFDNRLSALHSSMRPTQIKAEDLWRADRNIDKTLKAAQSILSHFDILHKVEDKILKGPHEDMGGYLEAMEQLKDNIQFFAKNKNCITSENIIKHSNILLAKAIAKLEEEFKQLLSTYSKPLKPELVFEGLPSALQLSSDREGESAGRYRLSNSNSDHHANNFKDAIYTPPVLLPPRIVPLLHTLAQQMVQSGNGKQLLKIYSDARSYVLEESLYKLGVGNLIKEDVQKMSLEELVANITNWVNFMRTSVKLLFTGEWNICDQIFEGMGSLKDQCFAEVSTNSFSMLLGFAEAIIQSKRSPDKLFVLLDMYDVLGELQPEIDSLYKGKACSKIRESTLDLRKQLAQIAQETIGDYEELVEKDAEKTALLDGNVHPLTSYVINYVKILIEHRTTLKQLFQEFGDGPRTESQLASVTMRVIQTLQANLYGKSKKYKDPALAEVFLMNNVHFVVNSVRRTEAKGLLGNDWIQRHRRIVQQHANQYQRISWNKILESLSVRGLTSSGGGNSADGGNSSGVSRTKVRDRLKMFNMQFEELHLRQSQWTVCDNELQESLRLKVLEVLLPAYRSFLKRFGALVGSVKNHQRYVKYTPDDLEKMLGDLFESKKW